jgi:hypothetical protein
MSLLLGSGGVFFWIRSEAVNNNKKYHLLLGSGRKQ